MKDKVMIHHSASSFDTTVEDINRWHEDRGFDKSSLGYFVGYHYVIDSKGIITQTRDNEETGCHCNSFDNLNYTSFNRSSIGICVIGNFEYNEPFQEQLDSLNILINKLKPTVLLAHKDVKDTLCCGKNLYSKVVAIRQQLNKGETTV